jgi:hypothetical protein
MLLVWGFVLLPVSVMGSSFGVHAFPAGEIKFGVATVLSTLQILLAALRAHCCIVSISSLGLT